jgi:protein O-mannosyl-transferase
MEGTTVLGSTHAARAGSSAHRWSILLGGGVLILAALAVYHNSFAVPFILDDVPSITQNPSIRHLWPLWGPLVPPRGVGMPVQGRPVVNLTLAINYALGGVTPWGYHAVNLAIHILAGLALFGIVRRTLLRPTMGGWFGAEATLLALAVGVIWTVHPLQTEAVTYVVQRAESLMGLFYLLTLYCFIRGTESRKPGRWYALSVTACLLGMGTKEVMVSAPLMVLLYDRMFVAGSFREAWTRRWRLYAGLAGTWVLLGYLVANTGNRGGSAGFGTEVAWWEYAPTQCRAIVQYLKLSVLPYPLVFDYGTATVRHMGQALPYAVVLTALAGGTVIALRRWHAIGFLGVWFFAILAPSSSVVPVSTQTMAEHRMYLPLAAVVTLVVMGIYALLGRRGVVVFLMLAVGLGYLTAQRNEDYRTELSIWSDTVGKCPDNARAHTNLGLALLRAGQLPQAIAQDEEALRIRPHYARAHYNLGLVLWQAGQLREAIAEYQEAVRIDPDFVEAHVNLGIALSQVGSNQDALVHFMKALRLRSDSPEVHSNLGFFLLQSGKLPEAVEHFEQALRINPDYVEAHFNLGLALEKMGRVPEAIEHYEQVLKLRPDYAPAKNALARLQAGS